MACRWGAAIWPALVQWVLVVAGRAVGARYGVRVAARRGLWSVRCRGICPPCTVRIVPGCRYGVHVVVPDVAYVVLDAVSRRLGPPGLAVPMLALNCPLFTLVPHTISVSGLRGAVLGWPVARVDLREVHDVVPVRGVFGLVRGVGVLVGDGVVLVVGCEVVEAAEWRGRGRVVVRRLGVVTGVVAEVVAVLQ